MAEVYLLVEGWLSRIHWLIGRVNKIVFLNKCAELTRTEEVSLSPLPVSMFMVRVPPRSTRFSILFNFLKFGKVLATFGSERASEERDSA